MLILADATDAVPVGNSAGHCKCPGYHDRRRPEGAPGADHGHRRKPLDGLVPLRNEPVQARSAARLTALLDATAAIIDEIGFERLTTAMVAERAGASIGTVYRYFPDRIAVLQALAARNLERVVARVVDRGRQARARATG